MVDSSGFVFLFKIGEAFLGRMSVIFYKEIGFTKTIFAQPSHLLGTRANENFKIDVSLIELGGKIFDPFMLGPLSDFRFINAQSVAKAMVKKMNDNSEGLSVLKYEDFVNS